MNGVYKEPKSIFEQIEILKVEKRIKFNSIKEVEAQEHLFVINYINLISPFKYNFAQKVSNDPYEVVKINGKHVYEQETDFYEYMKMYIDEKANYTKIFESIRKFESTFNSILSYRILMYYEINNKEQFIEFLDDLKSRLFDIEQEKIDHYSLTLSRFAKGIDKYNSVFIFLDRLSLGQQLIVYTCLPITLKKQIVKDLFIRDMSFKISDVKTFEKKLFTLVSIRNCVYHNNSIEILLRYYDVKEKSLRTTSDRKSFTNLIGKLVE